MEAEIQAPVDVASEFEAPSVSDAEGSVQETSDVQEERAPLSLDEAFSQVQQGESGSPSRSDATAAEEGSEDAAGGQAGQVQGGGKASVEAELDRIYTHIRQGRVHELPPNLRGRAQALQRDIIASHRQEQAEEEQFRDLFLNMEAKRIEDPDEFARLMFDDPNAGQNREFYELYRSAHPEVSLDNPDFELGMLSPEQVRASTTQELFTDLDAAILAMAQDAGIGEARVAELRSQSQGPWSYLSNAFTEAVKAAGEKERARIRDEERQAAGLEAQARYSGRSVVTPRVLGQAGRAPARDTSKPMTWEEALREAEQAAR